MFNPQFNQQSIFNILQPNSPNNLDILPHYHQHISQQNTTQPSNNFKSHKQNLLLSPPDNFMVKNILNQSPFDLRLSYQYYNIEKQQDDNQEVGMIKYEHPLLNSNKNSAKKSLGVSSATTKLDFNDWDYAGIIEASDKQEKQLYFSNNNDKRVHTKKRQNNKSKRNNIQKLQIKKQLSFETNYENSNKKNQKGLRNLSTFVRQIVFQLKITTYKEVANKLLLKLQQQNKINLNTNSKDQQNVKRRVYDALNVLISTQILFKNGKNVMINNNKKQVKGQKNSKYDSEKKKLLEQIILCQENIRTKYNKMINLVNKYHSIGDLKCRNKQQDDGKIKEKIRFPFIGLLFQKQSMGKVKNEGNRIDIVLKKQFKLMGDIDGLIKLGVKSKTYKKRLPQQIEEYIEQKREK